LHIYNKKKEEKVKLSEYAKLKGVCYRTAWNWFLQGRIPNSEQMENGTIIVNSQIKVQRDEHVVLYARVSTYAKKDDLERQMERLREFSQANGFFIKKEFKEIASGMNDNRKMLNKILKNQDYKTIVVENKDRLTRFGFNYITTLLKNQDREVVVVNEAKTEQDDLMKDFISVITSFCCRLYGMRKGLPKAKRIKEELKN
jgi:predicted site-specific integrase-resolvase